MRFSVPAYLGEALKPGLAAAAMAAAVLYLEHCFVGDRSLLPLVTEVTLGMAVYGAVLLAFARARVRQPSICLAAQGLGGPKQSARLHWIAWTTRSGRVSDAHSRASHRIAIGRVSVPNPRLPSAKSAGCRCALVPNAALPAEPVICNITFWTAFEDHPPSDANIRDAAGLFGGRSITGWTMSTQVSTVLTRWFLLVPPVTFP